LEEKRVLAEKGTLFFIHRFFVTLLQFVFTRDLKKLKLFKKKNATKTFWRGKLFYDG